MKIHWPEPIPTWPRIREAKQDCSIEGAMLEEIHMLRDRIKEYESAFEAYKTTIKHLDTKLLEATEIIEQRSAEISRTHKEHGCTCRVGHPDYCEVHSA